MSALGLSPFFARLSLDGQTVTMMRGAWKHRIRAADLPRWIALYRRLRDRGAPAGGKGPYWEFFEPGVIALEREAQKLKDRPA